MLVRIRRAGEIFRKVMYSKLAIRTSVTKIPVLACAAILDRGVLSYVFGSMVLPKFDTWDVRGVDADWATGL